MNIAQNQCFQPCQMHAPARFKNEKTLEHIALARCHGGKSTRRGGEKDVDGRLHLVSARQGRWRMAELDQVSCNVEMLLMLPMLLWALLYRNASKANVHGGCDRNGLNFPRAGGEKPDSDPSRRSLRQGCRKGCAMLGKPKAFPAAPPGGMSRRRR